MGYACISQLRCHVIGMLCRSGSGGNDSFGLAVSPAAAGVRQQQQAGGNIAMQPLPVATQPAPQQQQQQQQEVLPASPSAAGVRARTSRLGQLQQQAGTSTGGRAPQFTLGGDDTL
jgi:hypothetical protein